MPLITKQKGWAFVLGQALVLGILIVLPGRSDWPSYAPVRLLGSALFFGGLALVLFAGTRLGSALTPTPVPTSSAQLNTSGLYGLVRHPIYSGVLSIVIGMVLRSRSFVTLAVGITAVAYFYWKSSWEEQQLRDRYPEYDAYARRTPRFVPLPKS